MSEYSEDDMKSARKRVKELRHFYRHLVLYGVIILFLHIINWMTSSYYWAIWPTLGWGIAIVLHAARHMNIFPFLNEEWEERKVQEILAKKKGQV